MKRVITRLLLIFVGFPLAALFALLGYIFFRYADSRADIRRVMDGLTAADKKLPPGATEIFRVPRWRQNRDAIVERSLIGMTHPRPTAPDARYMGNTEWQLRWLCMSALSKLYTTEDERNALMWRELYFGYGGRGLAFAARTYFHKSPAELSTEDVVKLWTLAKSPNHFLENPGDFDRSSARDLAYWRAEAR
jgi:hypothetical protein